MSRAGARSGPLRVVEIANGTGHGIGAAALGRYFAVLGHHVVKVEPPGGDPLRGIGVLGADGVGLTFTALNEGKSQVVLEADQAGPQVLDGLLEGADVLISDLGPAAATAAGIDYAELRDRRPDLLVVAITSYGIDSALADEAGDSLLAECYGGLATMIGHHDRRPLALGGEQAAHAAAVAGLLGAMISLRDAAGGGLVDVALCDVAAYMDWKADIGFATTGLVAGRGDPRSGRWRMVRAADGWIGVIYQPEQWDAVVDLVGEPDLRDPRLRDEGFRARHEHEWWPVIERWAGVRPKEEIYRRAQARALPFGFCADIADLARSAQLRVRGFLQPDQTSAGSVLPPVTAALRSAPGVGGARPVGPHLFLDPPTEPADGRVAPLTGVVVLDFGTITAGAAASRLLADYGATVIKVESPSRPDPFRRWTPPGSAVSVAGQGADASPMFDSNNAGKLSLSMDLTSPSGRALVHELARHTDVVIENFRVGVPEKLGIGRAELAEINPDLVYVSLSSQGQQGPESRFRSYGSTLDLLSGLASVTGYDERSPVWSSAEVNYPDQIAAMLGAALAVYAVARDIRGVHLDISQREVVAWTIADRIAEFRSTGEVARPEGNRRPGRFPHDTFATRDGRWIAVSCDTPDQRRRLAEAVGVPWLREPEPGAGSGHAGELWLAGRVAGWARRRGASDAVRALRDAEVPCVPVSTASDRAGDPHFARRRVFVSEDRRRIKGFPFVLSRYVPPTPAPAPELGRDNEAIVRSLEHAPARHD
ncbi:CoA transferase [Pseudonocardia eucalypti]|uniref:CoA transferase n=1 Tax=Pseudonocardia eucalypti TaxID=648755 RepID=A0ABP9QK52_9PSEU|nr:crotonobetainyl-CoA:carnitine CoA-transferase CaiB-like acyl-CoA transferase [Pseudonocardia eucalypti]